jgi:hypothetical protein
MNSPIGSGGQYYPGSPQDQATRAQAQQQSQNLLGSVGGAIGKTVLGGLGIKAGLIDQILNTTFYSFCAVAGIGGMVMGLNLIVKEVPGGAGLSSYVGGAASTLGGGIGRAGGSAVGLGKGIGGKLAGKAATVAAPEVALPAKAVSKVVGPKVKAAVSSGPGEREKAARGAGLGAAQILRARREDKA